MSGSLKLYKELDGKVAVVTGAGRMRGIGHATAVILAQMGANVVVTGTGRNPETFPDDEKKVGWNDIHSVVNEIRELGVKGLPLVVDVTSVDQIQNMLDRTISEFGRLDIIVNNAAAPYGADRVPVVNLEESVFRNVIDVKLLGTFLCCKLAAIQMIEQRFGGRIINLSSTAGKRGSPKMAAYNAANFAIDGFSQALAKELASYDITVNCVCPGLTETARMDPMGRGDAWSERIKTIPIGRTGTDKEIADLIGFLAGPRAAYITGQAINVNGGMVTER